MLNELGADKLSHIKNRKYLQLPSRIIMLFYLDLIQNDTIVTSRCMHFIFCQGRELKLTGESVIPVTEKER